MRHLLLALAALAFLPGVQSCRSETSAPAPPSGDLSGLWIGVVNGPQGLEDSLVFWVQGDGPEFQGIAAIFSIEHGQVSVQLTGTVLLRRNSNAVTGALVTTDAFCGDLTIALSGSRASEDELRATLSTPQYCGNTAETHQAIVTRASPAGNIGAFFLHAVNGLSLPYSLSASDSCTTIIEGALFVLRNAYVFGALTEEDRSCSGQYFRDYIQHAGLAHHIASSVVLEEWRSYPTPSNAAVTITADSAMVTTPSFGSFYDLPLRMHLTRMR